LLVLGSAPMLSLIGISIQPSAYAQGSGLPGRVETLEAQVTDLENTITDLQNRVTELENAPSGGNFEIVTRRAAEETFEIPPNEFVSLLLPCNSDETNLGGGYVQSGPGPTRVPNLIWEQGERNSDGNNAYLLGYLNTHTETVFVQAWALCGKIVPAS
jgi:hypothetical protein